MTRRGRDLHTSEGRRIFDSLRCLVSLRIGARPLSFPLGLLGCRIHLLDSLIDGLGQPRNRHLVTCEKLIVWESW